MSGTTAAPSPYLPVRDDWLRRGREVVLEPELPIVDPHHHLWERPGWRYLLDDLLADIDTGHNIVATVFIQCRSMHRAAGPEEFRPVGETEFVNGVAAMSASGGYGPTRICAGIVGHVDLRLGARAEEVLAAHVQAGGGRFRGIRHITAWDADPTVLNPAYSPPPGLLGDAIFRQGFAKLAPLNLSFDAWLYHPQIDELADLARAFPDTRIVLNHVGGPLTIGSYAGKRAEVMPKWAASIRTLATCPNVCVKLGGIGMRIRRRPRCWPRRGSLISTRVSKHSVPRAACSRATSRWTKVRMAIGNIGTPARSCRMERARANAPICSPGRQRGSIGCRRFYRL